MLLAKVAELLGGSSDDVLAKAKALQTELKEKDKELTTESKATRIYSVRTIRAS